MAVARVGQTREKVSFSFGISEQTCAQQALYRVYRESLYSNCTSSTLTVRWVHRTYIDRTAAIGIKAKRK